MTKKESILSKLTLLLVIALIAFASFLVSHCFDNKRTLKGNPFHKNVSFENPSYAVTDNSLNYYVIDQSMRRIMKISKNKDILYVIEGGKRSSEHFFYAYDIAVDSDENLYVLNQVLDNNGFFIDREEIIKYDRTGTFRKVLYQRKYSQPEKKETLVQRGKLYSISITEGVLRWYEIDENGIYPNRIILSDKSYERGQLIPYKDACLYISGICRYNDDAIITTNKGEICSINKEGNIQVFYISNQANSIRSTPWSVATDLTGSIYFTDLGSREIKKVTGRNSASPILSKSIVEKAGYESNNYLYYRLSYDPENNLFSTANDSNIVSVTPDKGIHSYFSSGILSTKIVIFRILVWLSAFFAAVLYLFSFYLFYSFIMRKRFPLILKQLCLYIPLIIISIIAITYMVINDFTERYQKEILSKTIQMTQMSQQIANYDAIPSITRHENYMNPAYKQIRKRLVDAMDFSKHEWNTSYYFALYRVFDDSLYGFMYLNGSIGIYHPFNYFQDPDSIYRQAYAGKIVTEYDFDSFGSWMYAVGPLYDSKGHVVALIEIGTDFYNFNEQNSQLVYKMIRGVIIISLLFIIVFMMMTYLFLVSIRILRNAVHRISNGEWHTKVNIGSKNDEISDLGFGFNKMSEYILNYISEIVNLNKSYQRFVPEQFLHHLNKDNITKVQLGDQVQKTMSILSSNIHSFTALSEKMTSKENFDFINSYLGEIGPVIRKHHGFIDRNTGNSTMALFPQHADDAVLSALGMLDKVKIFNEKLAKNSSGPIDIGIGIHTGSLMLGIVGEVDHIEGTILSDNVDLASRLEELTKHFGAAIIISQVTMESISNREKFMYRYLGKMRIKDKKNSIGLFEILDAYTAEQKTLRIKTKDIFEKGIMLYQQKKFTEAASKFTKILTYDKDDLSTRLYLSICEKFSGGEIPDEEWDGTLIFNEK